jgi:hypothetical protein
MAEQAKVFPKPVDWDELYPGRFLKAGEFKGKKPTLTMGQVKIEELIGDKGPQVKGVVFFKETEKQWALNKTNGICLKAMFGRKVQEWVGRRVTLFAGTWDGEECIRVWGSPELQADMDVPIQLPRKRPFNMTMHAVRKGGPGGSAATNPPAAASGPPPSVAEANTQLRAAASIGDLVSVKKSIWALYAAANQEVPLEVEAFAHQHREDLESQA